jgi:hypothetical protein
MKHLEPWGGGNSFPQEGKEMPRFNDYRVTEDGVMVADVGFKKQLQTLDPELDVVWDWGAKKWEVWRFPGQKDKKKKRVDEKAMHVMTIQTRGRKFRELGADILLKLQAGDTTKFSLKELVAYFDQMDENIQRAKRRDLENLLHGITTEFADYMRAVPKIQVPNSYRIQRVIGG